MELISRNTEEIVTVEELRNVLKNKKNPVIYHGFEPTGLGIHIGYLIGLMKILDFQKAGLKVKILFADLHAWLNEKGSMQKIEKIVELYKEYFKAVGIDFKKAEAVLGSSFQTKKEYFMDVLKLSLNVREQRARRSMNLIGRNDENPHIAQMLYPLMQAEDIKALKVDIAFGDLAQRKVHMIAREELEIVEYKVPIAIHHSILTGLKGGKMSSSVPESTVWLDEEEKSIEEKIGKAYCPEKSVEGNPVTEICKYLLFPYMGKLKIERDQKYGGNIEFSSYEELEKAYFLGTLHPADLKKGVSKNLTEFLKPVKKKIQAKKVQKLKQEIEKMK